jgi:DNA polymerase/3'-5' exonuclease PolX
MVMELALARDIAEQLIERLGPHCHRIKIAGSIRRHKGDAGDIELLCIPKFVGGVDQLDREIGYLMHQQVLDYRRNKRDSRVYGPKNKLLLHKASGIGIDIFSTTEECWWVSLVVRTGGKQTNIRISIAAQERGYQFHAYGSGFTTPDGEIVCHSEREVFEAVDLPYRDPWERD